MKSTTDALSKKVYILIIANKSFIGEAIAHLLTNLNYHPILVDNDYKNISKILNSQEITCILLPPNLSTQEDGIYLAQTLRSIYVKPCIFYASKILRPTLEALKRFPLPIYISQPTNKDDLFVNIELAHYNAQSLNSISKMSFFFVKKNSSFFKINFTEVNYIKSEHIYLRIHTSKKEYLIRENLSHFLRKLPQHFIRCHRSYIVNLEQVIVIHQKNLQLQNQQEIPVTKNYRKQLLDYVSKAPF